MGLIEKGFDVLFGERRKLIRETAGIFMEPADEGAERDAVIRDAALTQYKEEFSQTRESRFDIFMNGVNRLPRPMLALGTLGLFVSAMVAPLWFAERMQGNRARSGATLVVDGGDHQLLFRRAPSAERAGFLGQCGSLSRVGAAGCREREGIEEPACRR